MNCQCEEVKARLVWPTSADASAYNITWQEESCSREKGSERRRKLAAWKTVQVERCLSDIFLFCTFANNINRNRSYRQTFCKIKYLLNLINIKYILYICEYTIESVCGCVEQDNIK